VYRTVALGRGVVKHVDTILYVNVSVLSESDIFFLG